MADLNSIAESLAQDETGTAVQIDDKQGNPYLAADGSLATITVLGSDAKAVVASRDRIQKRMLRTRATKLEPDDIRRNRIDQAAAAVVGWHGWEANGQPLPCTAENVKALLAFNHILEQVEAEVASARGFTMSSAT